MSLLAFKAFISFPLDEAFISTSGLHADAGVVRAARVGGLCLPFLDLDSFTLGMCLDAFLAVDFFRAGCMTGAFLEPVGLPRPRCSAAGFFLEVAFLDSLVLQAPGPLARKTRTGPSVLHREPAEVTAGFIRLLLPLVPLGGSVEPGDDFAASVESRIISFPRLVLESSSTSGSMPLLFNCYDPRRLFIL